MPYRVPEPRAPEPPAPARHAYRCTHCGATFDTEEVTTRCPRCLRRSAVLMVGGASGARAPDGALEMGDGSPEPRRWPNGSDCPLCASRPVGGSEFHLRISKHGGGYAGSSLTARGLCCGGCRARLESLRRLRRISIPLVLGGIVAWPFSLALEIPGWGAGASVAVATLSCALVVGVPIALVVRAQRRLRRRIEETSLFLRLRNAVETPRGLIVQEHWVLSPGAPSRGEGEVVDMKDFA